MPRVLAGPWVQQALSPRQPMVVSAGDGGTPGPQTGRALSGWGAGTGDTGPSLARGCHHQVCRAVPKGLPAGHGQAPSSLSGTKTSPASVETWAGSCLALSGSAGCCAPGASPLPAGQGRAPAGRAASSPRRPASAAGPAAARALPASAPSTRPAATLWGESGDAPGCGAAWPPPPLPGSALSPGLCRLPCLDLCQGASLPGTPSAGLVWERDAKGAQGCQHLSAHSTRLSPMLLRGEDGSTRLGTRGPGT